MPFEVLILIFGVLFVVGGFVLAGQWLHLRRPGEADPIIQRLASELESLRTDVQQLGSTVQRLEERVDFTERLLSPPEKVDPPTGGGG